MSDRTALPADSVAVAASALSLAWLAAAIWWPIALAPLVVMAMVGSCAIATLRRPRSRLYLALGAIAFWLCAGLAGAVLLRGTAVTGLRWVVVVLFLLPLPLVPWLYARTFAADRGNTSAHQPAVSGAASPSPDAGSDAGS